MKMLSKYNNEYLYIPLNIYYLNLFIYLYIFFENNQFKLHIIIYKY